MHLFPKADAKVETLELIFQIGLKKNGKKFVERYLGGQFKSFDGFYWLMLLDNLALDLVGFGNLRYVHKLNRCFGSILSFIAKTA
ncbi:MAG TPA: hypothetical protein DCF33_20110 [Saprospirales bacterium]|nr:hypothetical protein [Saprospirales bacterium]